VHAFASDAFVGASNNNNSLNDLLQEADALLKQPQRRFDPMIQQALDMCTQQPGPLKASHDLESQLRLMQSMTATRRPGTGGGDGLPMSPTGLGKQDLACARARACVRNSQVLEPQNVQLLQGLLAT
jgi:hypothetical protein